MNYLCPFCGILHYTLSYIWQTCDLKHLVQFLYNEQYPLHSAVFYRESPAINGFGYITTLWLDFKAFLLILHIGNWFLFELRMSDVVCFWPHPTPNSYNFHPFSVLWFKIIPKFIPPMLFFFTNIPYLSNTNSKTMGLTPNGISFFL